MELTRRELLAAAAVVAACQVVPFAPVAAEVADPFVLDELPIAGVAGECSGHHA